MQCTAGSIIASSQLLLSGKILLYNEDCAVPTFTWKAPQTSPTKI